MAFLLNLEPGRLVFAVSTVCALTALGCRQSEQIQSYTVPKETKADVAAPSDRMLAAILPTGEQAWFFKAVGLIAEIDKHEKEINEFFAGLSLGADGRANWKLPAGWKEEAGSGIREATIVIPGDERLEITVNVASWPGTQESLLANVNRWRGQMQLPTIGPQQLAEVTREAKAGARTITIVDLRGQFKTGGMTPPFASGAFGPRATGGRRSSSNLPAGHPPIDAELDANSNLPAGHPAIDTAAEPATGTNPPNETGPSEVPKFTAPASWKAVPAHSPRKAEFAITDGRQEARVTLIDFSANEGPMIADPLLNINRWRREVGLEEIQKDALAKATETIQIDGQPATFAAMIPDAAKSEQSQVALATLAAMVRNGDRIWFIKMMGSRDLVAARQNEFKTFLKSIKFSHGGAGNGNK